MDTDKISEDVSNLGVRPDNEPNFEALWNSVKRVVEAAKQWIEENSEALEQLARQARHHVLFKQAGWLPHHTTPFAGLHDRWSASELSAFLNTYYQDNWPSVRDAFETHLIASKVDDEAKATFIEALEAHGLGLYRVAPRLLFPEIERLARNEFHSGRVDKKTALLDEIRDKLERQGLGLSDLAPSGGGPVFAQFERMAEHLYKTVRTSEKVAELANDPVPNRHAAVHGLVSYRTMKSSLNALIMTEFMYRIIPFVSTG